MQWYFFAFLSPLLWAVSNHIDKYILSKYLKSSSTGILAIFTGVVGFLFSLGILIFSNDHLFNINFFHAIIIILNGILLIIAFIPYYYALDGEDVSSVVPLYQTIPIFSFIIGFFLLGETINLMQIIAGVCIILGSVFISIDLSKSGFHLRSRALLLMLLSSFLISIHFLVFKVIAIEETFWVTVFWEYLGTTIAAIFLLIFISNYRKQFIIALRTNSLAVILITGINEVINIAAKLFANFATLLVPVFIVNLANGLQPMFVFLIGLILTIFLPFINTEKISRKYLIQRIVAIVVLLVGTYLLIV